MKPGGGKVHFAELITYQHQLLYFLVSFIQNMKYSALMVLPPPPTPNIVQTLGRPLMRWKDPLIRLSSYSSKKKFRRHVSAHADADAVVALKKILRVFRERQIYPEAKVDRLINAVTSSLTGIRLVEFNIELGGAALSGESSHKSRMTPTTPPMAGKSLDSPHVSTPTIDTDSPEPKKVCFCSEI